MCSGTIPADGFSQPLVENFAQHTAASTDPPSQETTSLISHALEIIQEKEFPVQSHLKVCDNPTTDNDAFPYRYIEPSYSHPGLDKHRLSFHNIGSSFPQSNYRNGSNSPASSFYDLDGRAFHTYRLVVSESLMVLFLSWLFHSVKRSYHPSIAKQHNLGSNLDPCLRPLVS